MLRRACAVCGWPVRRSDFRAVRVLVGGTLERRGRGFANWVRPGVAHRECAVVSDRTIAELLRKE